MKKIGFFDESYRHGNDSDWFLRAKDERVPMAIVPEALLLRRFHSSNMTYEIESNTKDILRALRASVGRKRKQES